MTSHHAYLSYSNTLENAAIPLQYKKQSVDVCHIISDRLTIDTVRDLIELAQKKPLQSVVRVFVLVCSELAVEAQNALLKLLEEPPESAEFYVVIPKTAILLPTLLSRLSVQVNTLEDAHLLHSQAQEVFASFLKLSIKDRMELVAERTKNKDLVWIESLISGAESYCHNKKDKELISLVVYVRSKLGQRGSSSKMLLEYLALSVPKTAKLC
jgi:DNA polymerase III delta prime subunit